eukprot:7640698-Lingulodinium_polyedra.AAC.1
MGAARGKAGGGGASGEGATMAAPGQPDIEGMRGRYRTASALGPARAARDNGLPVVPGVPEAPLAVAENLAP